VIFFIAGFVLLTRVDLKKAAEEAGSEPMAEG
jgi:hypothetical protein